MSRKLLSGGIVVPVDGEGTVIKDGAVLIDGAIIQDVGQANELKSSHDFDELVQLEDKLLLPGFVNVHSHSGIIRGLAEDLPVVEWLDKHVDPTYEVMAPDEARAAYELCFAEGIRAGVTCTLDMWQHMDEAAYVAKEFGLRTILVPYVADDEDHDYLASHEDNVRLVEEHQGDANGRISVWFGLEHLSYASKETMIEAFRKAEDYNVGFHTHVEEAKGLADEIEEKYGKRPIELFDEWGILDSRTHLAHCVWTTQEEIQLLADADVSVAHCPTANQKLGSGIAPVAEMVDSNVTVGLGSDGNKANNRIDLIQEMKLSALLQKVDNLDPTLLPAEEVLRMATIEGAKALGMDDKIGSLEPGKRADLAIFDIDKFHMSPVLAGEYSNIIPNIVHALQAGDVDSVMVDGNFILKNGQFLPKSKQELMDSHKDKSIQLLNRRDNPNEEGGDLG